MSLQKWWKKVAALVLAAGVTIMALPAGVSASEKDGSIDGNTSEAAVTFTLGESYDYAQYTQVFVDVPDGGSVSLGESMPENPEAPDGDAVRFTGWQDEAGSPFRAGTPVKGDMEVHATWAMAKQNRSAETFDFEVVVIYAVDFRDSTDADTSYESARLTYNWPCVMENGVWSVEDQRTLASQVIADLEQRYADSLNTPSGDTNIDTAITRWKEICEVTANSIFLTDVYPYGGAGLLEYFKNQRDLLYGPDEWNPAFGFRFNPNVDSQKFGLLVNIYPYPQIYVTTRNTNGNEILKCSSLIELTSDVENKPAATWESAMKLVEQITAAAEFSTAGTIHPGPNGGEFDYWAISAGNGKVRENSITGTPTGILDLANYNAFFYDAQYSYHVNLEADTGGSIDGNVAKLDIDNFRSSMKWSDITLPDTTADTGYAFDDWYVTDVGETGDNSHLGKKLSEIQDVSFWNGYELTARFTELDTADDYTITFVATDKGTVNGQSKHVLNVSSDDDWSYVIAESNKFGVAAKSGTDFFTHWTVDGESTKLSDMPGSKKIDKNYTITAQYDTVEIPAYTVIFVATDKGTVNGQSTHVLTVNAENDWNDVILQANTLTVKPKNSMDHFIYWFVDETNSELRLMPRTDKIQRNYTLTAVYAREEPGSRDPDPTPPTPSTPEKPSTPSTPSTPDTVPPPTVTPIISEDTFHYGEYNEPNSRFTPIGDVPIPLAEMSENFTSIFDDEIPLASLPTTGAATGKSIMILGLSLLAAGAALGLRPTRRNGKKNSEK